MKYICHIICELLFLCLYKIHKNKDEISLGYKKNVCKLDENIFAETYQVE